MLSKPRINALLETKTLDTALTGIPSFELRDIKLDSIPAFELPTNRRLGHLAEEVVAELIHASSNYELIHKNIQLVEDKKTIGELDFIVQETNTQQLTHLELAYKFYLFDPTNSSESIDNWIGPNRNDSLSKKLVKLKEKQFPLLHHPACRALIGDVEDIAQALCFMVSLFVPHEFKGSFAPNIKSAIVGYYLGFEKFKMLDTSEQSYYIPPRKEWGLAPSENEDWESLKDIEEAVTISLREKQAVLLWQKEGENYSSFIVVWW